MKGTIRQVSGGELGWHGARRKVTGELDDLGPGRHLRAVVCWPWPGGPPVGSSILVLAGSVGGGGGYEGPNGSAASWLYGGGIGRADRRRAGSGVRGPASACWADSLELVGGFWGRGEPGRPGGGFRSCLQASRQSCWLAALNAQASKSAVPVAVEADGIGRFGQDTEAAVYFCCLEALQNTVKYAHATNARIYLEAQNGTLRFTVSDNGTGYDARHTPMGSGLRNMADRLAALGGRLDVRSAPGQGTAVTGHLPVLASSSNHQRPAVTGSPDGTKPSADSSRECATGSPPQTLTAGHDATDN